MYLYEALENSILGSAFQKSAIKLKCKINCYICNILYGLQKFYKNIDSDKIGFYQKHQSSSNLQPTFPYTLLEFGA